MGELRKDYFRERYVIINSERAKRPNDFLKPPSNNTKPTPFAPGNEKELPGILFESPNGPAWQFRVVPNKFAIVRPEGQQEVASANELYNWASNYGYHEVVVEGREDFIPFASLGAPRIAEAIRIAMERVERLLKLPGINSVAYFKNEGLDAGASIAHPHSQIIATAFVPPSVRGLIALHTELRAKYGFSPLYKILDHERGSPRIVRESKHFVALCPYASRFPMEVLIIPLRDTGTYLEMTDEERADLAEQLAMLLGKLATIGSPYNLEWMHAPKSALHWHISLTPRLSIWAGYEIETNVIVNPIPPEHAAAFYRE